MLELIINLVPISIDLQWKSSGSQGDQMSEKSMVIPKKENEIRNKCQTYIKRKGGISQVSGFIGRNLQYHQLTCEHLVGEVTTIIKMSRYMGLQAEIIYSCYCMLQRCQNSAQSIQKSQKRSENISIQD